MNFIDNTEALNPHEVGRAHEGMRET